VKINPDYGVVIVVVEIIEDKAENRFPDLRFLNMYCELFISSETNVEIILNNQKLFMFIYSGN